MIQWHVTARGNRAEAMGAATVFGDVSKPGAEATLLKNPAVNFVVALMLTPAAVGICRVEWGTRHLLQSRTEICSGEPYKLVFLILQGLLNPNKSVATRKMSGTSLQGLRGSGQSPSGVQGIFM